MKQRALLFVGGGLETVPGIEQAQAMGLHVVVSDLNPQAPGMEAADDMLVASTYDTIATVAAATEYHRCVRQLDGVLCLATDVPLTVASVAAALDLPGIPVEVAARAMDKVAMKDRFTADGVPVPWFRPIDSAKQLVEVVGERGYPLVVKPVDSRGARGVLRLTGSTDLEFAFDCARFHSPTGRVMVEEFLSGPQVSTESVVVDGSVFTPGFSDRNYALLERFAPHIIEDGGELPSHLPVEMRNEVCRVVAHAATSLGVSNGVVKGDIVVHDNRAHVIELAARLSGGYFCTHEIPLSTGVDFVGAAIRIALGEKPSEKELRPLFQRGVAQRYLFPSPGRVVGIEGADAVAAMAGIALCEIRVRIGDLVTTIDSHPGRAGVIIATGHDRDEARRRAEDGAAAIRIETRPE